MDLENFKCLSAPSTVYYIPNFITVEEEEDILKNIYAAPKPKWTYLSNRRLQDYGGVPHEKGMIPEKIPKWLQKYIDKIWHLKLFDDKKPNQVLVNEYLPGQGIMPHTDGPLFYPIVTTISCGSHTILKFLENDSSRKHVCDILLERRSLVIITDELYSKFLHSIEEVLNDTVSEKCINLKSCDNINVGQILNRETRVSVTIRYVPKVLKINLFNK